MRALGRAESRSEAAEAHKRKNGTSLRVRLRRLPGREYSDQLLQPPSQAESTALRGYKKRQAGGVAWYKHDDHDDCEGRAALEACIE